MRSAVAPPFAATLRSGVEGSAVGRRDASVALPRRCDIVSGLVPRRAAPAPPPRRGWKRRGSRPDRHRDRWRGHRMPPAPVPTSASSPTTSPSVDNGASTRRSRRAAPRAAQEGAALLANPRVGRRGTARLRDHRVPRVPTRPAEEGRPPRRVRGGGQPGATCVCSWVRRSGPSSPRCSCSCSWRVGAGTRTVGANARHAPVATTDPPVNLSPSPGRRRVRRHARSRR